MTSSRFKVCRQMKKILYLTYDGILEPLGYSQVFKYIEKLSTNFKITLISLRNLKI